VNTAGEEETADAAESLHHEGPPGETEPIPRPSSGPIAAVQGTSDTLAVDLHPIDAGVDSPKGALIDQQAETGGIVKLATPADEPLFYLSDGAPVFGSQWRPGVIELQDVGNDIRSRVERNAVAPDAKKYSRDTVLLAERLIMAIGPVLNTLIPPQLGRDHVDSYNEAVNFLGSRVRLAASKVAASNSPTSVGIEL
jgi:hypothetical protein